MKQLKFYTFTLLLFYTVYILLPSPSFPPPPPNSLQSSEPADTESIYRRSYFTNMSREELVDYYRTTFDRPFYPSIKLNHPPEFAADYIRDQARSSYLEEVVHPFRESLYINGYTPTDPRYQINRNGVHYATRATIRYVPSSAISRLTALGLLLVGSFYLLKQFTSHHAF